MFKIESYLTPYLLSYFDKYIKDFKTEDSKLSLWEGGATFNNLNLDLESLEDDFSLPLKFISGHLQELHISVPWTKLTSEPIHLKIKTIELNVGLKRPNSNNSNRSSPLCSNDNTPPGEPETPPSYIQSLFNKIITNLSIECENVIIKFVEENIVFSLNIKSASYSTVDHEWKPAVIDILPPEHLLRKKLSFTDITVCLDQTNSNGRVVTYQEPLLYKYSFDVKFTQQYSSPFSRNACLTRMEIALRDMKFTMTDEQVVLFMKIYYLLNFVGQSEYIPPEIPPIETSTTLTLTLGHFQWVIHDTVSRAKPCTQMVVLDLRDISSSLERQNVYNKLTLRIHSISLGLFERLDTERLEIGRCLEVFLTSGSEFSRNLSIVQTTDKSISIPTTTWTSSSSHLPVPSSGLARPKSGPGLKGKPRGWLLLNYTKVQSKDFYKKSDSLASPMSKWNQTLQEFYEADFQSYAASDNHEYQTLIEYDLKMRSLDIVINPSVLLHYRKILQGLGSLRSLRPHPFILEEQETCSLLPYSNQSLPLLYLETEEIRLLFHLESTNPGVPDGAIFQLNSILIQPQADNPLHRSFLKPNLYEIGAKANILAIPGSPLEDRHYQMDIQGVSILSCFWAHIEATSKKIITNRLALINPEETCKKSMNTGSQKTIHCHPILNKIDISFTFGAAIVFAQDPEEYCTFSTVAGYAFELNISSDIMIFLDPNQVRLLKQICSELNVLWNIAYPGEGENNDGTTLLPGKLKLEEGEEEEEGEEKRKKNPIRFLGHNHNHGEIIPLDLLITTKSIHLNLYQESLSEPFPMYSSLGYLRINQPHCIVSTCKASQRAELSFFGFDFSVAPHLEAKFDLIPEGGFCTQQILLSTTGEKNPKTGMMPPFFTLSISDFSEHSVILNLKRGLHVNVNEAELRKLANVLECFAADNQNVISPLPPSSDRGGFLQLILHKGRVQSIQVHFVCFYFAFNDDTLPTAKLSLSLDSGSLDLGAFYKINKTERRITRIESELKLRSVSITTTYANRRDVLVNPLSVHLSVAVHWFMWDIVPCVVISADFSPITINIGTENVLAILHLYKTLVAYMFDLLTLKNEALTDILETETLLPKTQYFEDDLRNGSFQYIQTKSSSDLPAAYQIAFSNSDLTMTWKYPTPRSITHIDSKPIPLDSFESQTLMRKTLNCVIEYWDDSRKSFIHFGELDLSDRSCASVQLPKDNVLVYNPSVMWRIIIKSPLNDDSIKTELLAASLVINSQGDPIRIPRLKMYMKAPRLRINLVNQLGLLVNNGGNKMYQIDKMKVSNQPFAKIEFLDFDCQTIMWYHRCESKVNAKFRLDVVEFSHLTENNLIDDTEFKYAWTFTEESKDDVKTYFELITKPVLFNIGASALHSLSSSILNAKHFFLSIHESLLRSSTAPNLTQFCDTDVVETLICNDTSTPLAIRQVGGVSNGDQVIGERHCLSYIWPKPKNKPECQLGFKKGDWKWSDNLYFASCESKPIRLGDRVLFLSISPTTSYQRLVKLYGSLSVANFLNEGIQVAYLLKGSSEEELCDIPSRSHGPSQLFHESELEHVRFRKKKCEGTSGMNYPWSMPISIAALKETKCFKIPLSLYEESEKQIKTFNVWCSLVEEEIEGSFRYLFCICPFYYIRSLLPYPTTVKISYKGNENGHFLLNGRGDDIQIDFSGDPTLTHLLSFQTNEKKPPSSSSAASIPVAPDGPASINERIVTSIDSLLEYLNEEGGVGKELTPEKKWPYIAENLNVLEWTFISQPDTKLDIRYKHWIEGIPTVLIEACPKALCVNLTGVYMYFSLQSSKRNYHMMTSPSAFSPPSYEEPFKFGIKMSGTTVWSDWIEITDQKSRLDIHPVCGNNKIPLNSYSRLEIKSKSETCYLTIEARLREGTVILILRPTFSLLNRTEHKLYVTGLDLRRKQKKEEWDGFGEDSLTLSPTSREICLPLLKFRGDNVQGDGSEAIKFLGIRLSSTWYFLPLFKYEDICNRAISDGISGQRITFALPDFKVIPSHATRSRDLRLLRKATISLILNWTFKNGQFWLLFVPDPSPDVTICNFTDLTFMYNEADFGDEPFKDNPFFEQSNLVLPSSISHLSFQNVNEFPRIGSRSEAPAILLKTLSLEENNTSLVNLLGFKANNWLKKIKLDEETSISQSLRISAVVDIKLELEKCGSCYFVFIEYMSNAEVSAKTIRGRISNRVEGPEEEQVQEGEIKGPTIKFQDETIPLIPEEELESRKRSGHKERYGMSLTQMMSSMGTIALQRNIIWSCRVYIPEVHMVFTNDRIWSGERNVFAVFSFVDLFYERNFDESDKRKYEKILNIKIEEDTIHQLYIGDMQIDAPLLNNPKHDFQVILKQEKAYASLGMRDEIVSDLEDFFTSKLSSMSGGCLVECLVYFGPNMRDIKNFWLKINPIILNVEDYLFESIFPTLYSTYALYLERSESMNELSEFFDREMHRVKLEGETWGTPSTTVSSSPCRSLLTSDSPLRCTPSPSFSNWEDKTPLPTLFASCNQTSELEYPKLIPPGNEALPLPAENLKPTEKPSDSKRGVARLKPPPPLFHLKIPGDVNRIFEDISVPFRVSLLMIEGITVLLTVRMSKRMYLAVDNSPLLLRRFHEKKIITTWYGLGQMLSNHYFLGTIFESGNSLSLLGSLELLGSPTNLARNLSLGLRDFVVYPYNGLLKGPLGFIIGLHYGCSSLVRHIASGTLTSVTNLAWSVSRNIDKFTLDEDEQHWTEEARRAEYYGFVGGFLQGLSGFGIRILGALGTIAHSPMSSVMQNGVSPGSVLRGMSKGMFGAVARPIGGAVELMAITGQTILVGVGWKTRLEASQKYLQMNVETARNTLFRYNWRLVYELKDFGENERILLVTEGMRRGTASSLEPVAMILTNEKLHLLSNKTDEFIGIFHLSRVQIEVESSDGTSLYLRPLPSKHKGGTSLAEERLIEFVRESSSSVGNFSLLDHQDAEGAEEVEGGGGGIEALKMDNLRPQHNEALDPNLLLVQGTESEETLKVEEGYPLGNFLMDPQSKQEFVIVFNWSKLQV